MKENVLDVLMYLFENYMIDGGDNRSDQERLAAELSQVGFGHGEIDKAFCWLEDLSDLCENGSRVNPLAANISIRHFSPEESCRIDREAQGLLLSLQNAGVLEPATREIVIDRIMALDIDDIDLDQVKWVTMMVLCNQQEDEEKYSLAEDLILGQIDAPMH